MPVIVKGAAVFVNEILPLVVLVALKLVTVLPELFKVVPVPDVVVNNPPSKDVAAVWEIAPPRAFKVIPPPAPVVILRTFIVPVPDPTALLVKITAFAVVLVVSML